MTWTGTGETKELLIGTLPVMLGSNLCHWDIAKTTEEERIKLGMARNDPLGYFISEGREKVVIGQDFQRLNRIILGTDKKTGSAEVRTLNPNAEGGHVLTKVIEAKVGNKKRKAEADSDNPESLIINDEFVVAIKLFKSSTPKEMGRLNLFSMFQLFGLLWPEELKAYKGFNDVRAIISILKLFIPSSYTGTDTSIEKKILDTFNATEQSFESNKTLRLVEAVYTDLMDYSVSAESKITPEIMKNVIRDEMRGAMFPHINEKEPLNKLLILAKMAVRLASYRAGTYATDKAKYATFDNRDSFSIKRIPFAATMVENLATSAFKQCIRKIIDEKSRRGNTSTLSSFTNSYQTRIFDDVFSSSFRTNEWGTKNIKRKDVAQTLKRESPVGTVDHLHTIDVGSLDRNSREDRPRQVQASQYELIDPSATPDGDKCGLTKKLAITAFTTIDKSAALLREWFSKFDDPNRPPIKTGPNKQFDTHRY